MNTSIRNCSFAYRCTQQWEGLQPTAVDTVRFCAECRRKVYFCETPAELSLAIKLNHCVAMPGDPLNPDEELRPTVGVPSRT